MINVDRVTLELNTAKCTNYIKKWFKQKLFEIKFHTGNSMGAYLYFPQQWSCGAPNICHFLNNALEWEGRFFLGLNAAESTDCIEKMLKTKTV